VAYPDTGTAPSSKGPAFRKALQLRLTSLASTKQRLVQAFSASANTPPTDSAAQQLAAEQSLTPGARLREHQSWQSGQRPRVLAISTHVRL